MDMNWNRQEASMKTSDANHSMVRHAIALALLLASFSASGQAKAECLPASPVNDTTVTCTGVTVNQNIVSGYGSLSDTGNTYNILPGASVTGSSEGLSFTSGTVNNSGTIVGTDALGIRGSARINNIGTITGQDFGINSLSIDTIDNAGFILGGQTAIFFGNGTANIRNSGTIAAGPLGFGIAGVTLNLENSGTISTTAGGAVRATNAKIDNSGVISADLGNGVGISVSAATTVNNTRSGIIVGGAVGIFAGNAQINNAGTISGRIGIEANFAGFGTAITNSGTIIGTGGTAVRLTGAADTLTLLTGSRVVGTVDMGGGNDTVNILVTGSNTRVSSSFSVAVP
ncbi:MAG: hypothetical protein Q8K88_08985, partial [Bradyrhizobium sp.]|nr:hypothetical protein [Bradyrhizobium sp.]